MPTPPLAKLLLTGIICLLPLTACERGTAKPPDNGSSLKVGAAATPHADILNFVKPALKAEGIDLQVVIIDEEGWMNPALAEGQIDANYFQHLPYLQSVAREKGYNFAVAAKIHVEPIGFYSHKLRALAELKDGALIAIPNNPSNEYRTLALLEHRGLLRLRPGINNFEATPRDIVDNPKRLRFVEIESAQLVRALPDVDGALINTNYVLMAQLDPNSALFREDADSLYANILVVRSGDEQRAAIRKLVAALQSPAVKTFLQEKFGAAVVPAFP